jgi:hypothetical protein
LEPVVTARNPDSREAQTRTHLVRIEPAPDLSERSEEILREEFAKRADADR